MSKASSEFLRLEHRVQQVHEKAEREQPAHDVNGVHSPPRKRDTATTSKCVLTYSTTMITMNTASILLPPARVKTRLIYCPACEFRVRESSWTRSEHSGKRIQGLIKSLFRASYGRSGNDALVYMLGAFIVSVGDDMPRIRG
jgi:hypothetical protein